MNEQQTMPLMKFKDLVQECLLPYYPPGFRVPTGWSIECAGNISSRTDISHLQETLHLIGKHFGSKVPGVELPQAQFFLRALRNTALCCRWTSGDRHCQLAQCGSSDNFCEWHHELVKTTVFSASLESFTDWLEVQRKGTTGKVIYLLKPETLWSAVGGYTDWYELVKIFRQPPVEEKPEIQDEEELPF